MLDWLRWVLRKRGPHVPYLVDAGWPYGVIDANNVEESRWRRPKRTYGLVSRDALRAARRQR